jgi:hypothetical protein
MSISNFIILNSVGSRHLTAKNGAQKPLDDKAPYYQYINIHDWIGPKIKNKKFSPMKIPQENRYNFACGRPACR